MQTNKELYLENKKLLQRTYQDNIRNKQEDERFIFTVVLGVPSLFIIGSLLIIIFV